MLLQLQLLLLLMMNNAQSVNALSVHCLLRLLYVARRTVECIMIDDVTFR